MARRISGSKFNAALGARVRQIRQDRKVWQQDLAKLLGVTPQTMSCFENGKSSISALDVTRLAEFFNMPVTDILPTPSQYHEV